MKSCLVIMLAIIAFVSCSPLSKEYLKQVDQDLTLKEVLKNADQYKGTTVLWGGAIIETINKPGETLIIVMQTALDYEDRPKSIDWSEGRFIVKQTGFLDPEIYAKDRKITVVGKISGKEDFPLGEIRYLYPVVEATKLILWEKLEYQPFYHDPFYHDPWYWEPYPFRWYHPYHRRR